MRTVQQYPKGRTEAITDGVIAIVITLLVLDLGVGAGAEDDLWQALLDEWPSYVGYFISFFTVAAFWLRSHAITNTMDHVDSVFMQLNLVALFFLTILPFPTSLMAEFLESGDAEDVAVVVYGVVLFLAALSVNLLWRYASRGRRLLRSDTSDEEITDLNDSLSPSLIGYLVAIGVGFVAPLLAVALYFLMALLIAAPLGWLRAAIRRA